MHKSDIKTVVIKHISCSNFEDVNDTLKETEGEDTGERTLPLLQSPPSSFRIGLPRKSSVHW